MATAYGGVAIAKADEIVVRDPEWGRRCRVAADPMPDGRPLAAMQIAAGHGRPYGGGARWSWCP